MVHCGDIILNGPFAGRRDQSALSTYHLRSPEQPNHGKRVESLGATAGVPRGRCCGVSRANRTLRSSSVTDPRGAGAQSDFAAGIHPYIPGPGQREALKRR